MIKLESHVRGKNDMAAVLFEKKICSLNIFNSRDYFLWDFLFDILDSW